MPCYHPMVAWLVGYSKHDHKPVYKMAGDLYGNKHPTDKLIPCGQCIGCRLDKSREWADRMMIELDHSKKGLFCTFTFSPEALDDEFHRGMLLDDGSWTYTLYKRDFQLFMKRLREYFEGKEIRFYAAGEYGDNTLRPHYHAILFGLSLEDFPDHGEPVGFNEFHQPYYGSDLLDRLWSNGFTSLSLVSWSTCAYVSRYVTKKLTGQQSIYYMLRNVEPEFSLMSRRPGIGGYFLEDHPDVTIDSKVILDISNDMKFDRKGNVRRPRREIYLPKYIFDKFELICPEEYDKFKFKRSLYANDKLLLELSKTDLECSDYLRLKEKRKKASMLALKRDSI